MAVGAFFIPTSGSPFIKKFDDGIFYAANDFAVHLDDQRKDVIHRKIIVHEYVDGMKKAPTAIIMTAGKPTIVSQSVGK